MTNDLIKAFVKSLDGPDTQYLIGFALAHLEELDLAEAKPGIKQGRRCDYHRE